MAQNILCVRDLLATTKPENWGQADQCNSANAHDWYALSSLIH